MIEMSKNSNNNSIFFEKANILKPLIQGIRHAKGGKRSLQEQTSKSNTVLLNQPKQKQNNNITASNNKAPASKK
jgi:hypothetical protein